MAFRSSAVFGMLLVVVLSACGGGGGGGDSSNATGPQLPSLPAFARYAFGGEGGIRTYRVDNDSGHLIPVRINDIAAGPFLSILPNGSTLYTPCDTDLICQAAVGADGSLSELLPRVATGTNPVHAAVDRSGRYVYIVNLDSDDVSQYRVESDGRLMPLTAATVAAGTDPIHVAIDPASEIVYVVNQGSNDIARFRIGTDGALSEILPRVPVGPGPRKLLIDRLGQYLYVSVYDSQEIAQYRIGGDGGLTELLPRIPTSPSSSSAEAPEDINLDPLNRFVYAVLLDGTERLYQIDSDGRLSEVSPAPVTPGSARIYFDPTGRFLYTPENVRDENHSIYQYRIAADGSLSPVAPASTIQGAAGTDLVFSGGDMPVQPIPAALYIGHADGQISQYTIDSDGSLNPMTPATVAANGSGVFGLATSASAEYLYATTQSGSGADQIAQFSIGTDGTLSALVPPNVTVANRVGGIAIDLTEEWVYALAPQADVAFEHRVGSGGTLSPASTPTSTMGDDPTGITVHPNGKYAYVADLDGNSVSVYEMNLANGAGVADALGDLELLATEPAGERLTGDVGVTPDGRYLYAVNAGKFTNVRFGNLAQFEIAADGTLSSLMPATIDVGPDTSSVAIAVHPSGLYVYVVNGNDDTIAQFAVGADGTLSQVGTLLATGVTPVAVAIEPSGRFLYVADGRFAPAIPAIAVFAIDQADGRLAALPGSPFATYSSRHSSIAITGSRR